MATGGTDGSLRFDTKVNTEGFDAGMSTLTKAVEKLSGLIETLTKRMEGAFLGAGSASADAAEKVEEVGEAAAESSKKVESVADSAKKAREEMERMKAEKAAVFTGTIEFNDGSDLGPEKPGRYDIYGRDVDEVIRKNKELEAAARETANTVMEETEKEEHSVVSFKDSMIYAFEAFKKLPMGIKSAFQAADDAAEGTKSKTRSLQDEIDQYADALYYAERAGMGLGDKAYDDAYTGLARARQKAEEYKKSLLGVDGNQKQVAKSSHKMGDSLKRVTGKATVPLTQSILKLSSMFKLMLIRMAMRAAIQAAKEGFQNLAQYSEETNKSISMLVSANTRLKNSFATAFAPLIDAAAPALRKLIDLISEALSKVGQLSAALSGKTTFVKAVDVEEDYGAALKTSNKELKEKEKANKKLTFSFDNLIQAQESSEKNDYVGPTPDQMFETINIEDDIKDFADMVLDTFSTMFDAISNKWKELSNQFSEGFKMGVGDLSVFESIKENVTAIGDSLKGIFMDKDVVSAFDTMLDTLVYNAGRIAGAFASVGLTIADNLTGGIALYLESAKDRIKGYLISMFDITSEISTIGADFAVAVADIFSVFRSGTAKQITADIIAIYADIFMGITELSAKLFRDVLDTILTPFIENKDRIKEALANTMEPIKTVLDSISQGITETFENLNRMYDEHIAPLFESIKNGLSEVLGNLLDGYNQYIAPTLQKLADKFSEVYEGTIQPLINKIIGLIGKVADLLKTLWENILQPLIAWIVKHIMPVIEPILEGVGTVLMDLLDTAFKVVDGIITALSGIIDFLTGVFSGDWGLAWEGIKEIFSGVLDAISGIVVGVVSTIGDYISGALKTLGRVIKFDMDAIKMTISTIWNAIYDSLTNLWNSLKGDASNIFEGIGHSISDVWQSVLDKTKEIWNGIWGAVENTIGKIASGVESMVNDVIGGINGLIKAINGVLEKVGISISSIPEINLTSRGGYPMSAYAMPASYRMPRLATGTVVPPRAGEFAAILGDNNRDTEIVSPVPAMKQAFKEAIEEMGGIGGNRPIRGDVYLERQKLGRIVYELNNQETQRVGVRMVVEG